MRNRLFLVLVLLAGCATAPKSMENIPLVWLPERHPTASVGAASEAFLKTKIKVVQMSDSRQNPKQIGENREQTPARPVTTSDDVAAFVTDHFKALISGAGLTVVDSGESVILKGDVQQFFVTETEQYVGDVRLRITATDTAGKTLWDGSAAGTSTRTGRSYRADNYYQSLSDALSEATTHLVDDPAFQAAVTRK